MTEQIVAPIPLSVDEHKQAMRALRIANELLNCATTWQRIALVDYGGHADLMAFIPAIITQRFHFIANAHPGYVEYRKSLPDDAARVQFDQMVGRNIFRLIEQRVRGVRRCV